MRQNGVDQLPYRERPLRNCFGDTGPKPLLERRQQLDTLHRIET
jgi:hypothetical protein